MRVLKISATTLSRHWTPDLHQHPATLRQLPGNTFDVAQSGSPGHYRSPSRILRKAHFWPPLPHNADRFNAFKKGASREAQ